ncbi:hypothetical protein WISP_57107 [Willisornis vidua]|uniref:TBC1 domain family member 30 n=1 Tax=Willisornis vidua TaxID=1566151 RepID=A0ABQ9DEM6_9PASS|nr:hypothetical protein WISP_57107 [Willisornis vidua]
MEAGEAGAAGRAGSSADSLAEEEEEDEDEGAPRSGRSSRTSSLGQLTQMSGKEENSFHYLCGDRRNVDELTTIKRELSYRISLQSAKLLRLLKQKDRLVQKVQKNCDIVTACLQAVSQKRWYGAERKIGKHYVMLFG